MDGPPGALPSQLLIELPAESLEGVRYGRPVTSGTRLDVSPTTLGQLEFSSPTTLAFRPANGFRYGTDYEVRLVSIETPRGVARPQEGSGTFRFSTPPFALMRVRPREMTEVGKLAVELEFSGDVQGPSVPSLLRFEVGGRQLRARVSGGTDRRILTAELAGDAIRPGAIIEYSLLPGARSVEQAARAGAANGSFQLYQGPDVTVHGVRLKESATGFFVEVSCTDAAAPGGAKYQWEEWRDENEGSWHWDKRPRCMLRDEDVESSVVITPKVKFSLVESHVGFRILGDFPRGQYHVKLRAGTRSVDNGVLQADYDSDVTVGARSPQLRIAATGRYLPRTAWRSLPVSHLNVSGATLTVRNIPEQNLVFWMSEDAKETANERNSNLLLKKDLSFEGKPDAATTTWVDVASLLPSTTRGVLELQLKAPGATATRRILLTELSLVAKRSGTGEVLVWALDIGTGKALSGVEVSLIRKSGFAVARCQTDGDEGCMLKPSGSDPDPSPPFALVARRGEDLTYLKYDELKTEIADSDVQGEPYATASARPYHAALYTDRGVYRPGDTTHLTGIVREATDRAPKAGLPVELRLNDPKGKVASKTVLKTNEAGLVTLDHPFAAFADTGVYTAELRVADQPLTLLRFNVEEFVPERMKVQLATVKPAYEVNEPVEVAVQAKYLFGGSAEGSKAELSCSVQPAAFHPKDNGQYTYGVWRDPQTAVKPTPTGQVNGELDGKGQATLSCPALAGGTGFKGAAQIVGHVAVFEAGSGRSTQSVVSVPIHPERYYLGLSSPKARAEAGKPIAVQGVVVDWNGALVNTVTQVEVEFVRLDAEYTWNWEDESGEERFQRLLRPVVEGRTKANVEHGRFTVTAQPSEAVPGYLVRVRAGAAQTDLYLEGTLGDFGWDESNRKVDQTPRPARATPLSLKLPQELGVGQRATVHLKAPYAGRILLTAETDHVLKAEWLDARAGDLSWSFSVEKFVPNVYVSALLVKDPHLESQGAFMPDRAFGVASAPVKPTELGQDLKLVAPASVGSNSKLTVELQLSQPDGPTYATVAAVDEGILSLTGFKSPDPNAILLAKRALGVETFETIGWTLLLPAGGPSRSTGGDAAGALNGRVQPVKPVALWSGLVPVHNGRASVTFDVPQYRGALRVMAVTAGPARVGHASATVTVKDPIVVETTLPRFLTQGDQFQIPVFLSNVSGHPADVTVSLSAENLPVPGMASPAGTPSPLKLLGKPEGVLHLADGKSGTLVFQAQAVQVVGAARLKVTARSGSFEAHDELDVPFTPAGPRTRQVQRIELAEGETDLAPYLKDWEPTTERTTFWVTTNPYGESFDHLRYVVQYPYGCIEQTTSSTRPLLFVSRILKSEEPDLFAKAKLEDMVMAGINRVFSMQTPSGGLAYWPGGTEPNGWGSAYATHMLLDAAHQGYPVPQDRLKEVLDWMEGHVEQDGNRDMYHEHGEDEARAYMGYVLALAGRPHKASLTKSLEGIANNAQGEAAERRYMLQAALYLAGDHRYESELKHPDVSALTNERVNDWSFYSDRRRRGFMLSTFTDLFGGDPAGEPLAALVAEGLRAHTSGWYTTQEITWGVTGLGKRLEGMAADFQPPTLTVQGETLAPVPGPTHGGERSWSVARASELPNLKLKLPSKSAGKVFLVVASEGVAKKAEYVVGGHGLSVERTFHARDGSVLDLHKPMQLAQLAYVQVTLTNTSNERIQNIALVDRLPAGWEIENPRLGRGEQLEWAPADSAFKPENMNVRDDRIELFGALERRESKTFTYGVRAVTSGSFTLPPVEAEAMYDPSIWARAAGGKVVVQGPWTDELL
jgi:uncharacterized protein YfaS (alpha-2-macroglobulin family)